jgi:CRP-like cAMP-binding protein
LLGKESLRMLAIGSEQRNVQVNDALFREGETADCGYVVRRGSLRVTDATGAEVVAGAGALIGELALVVEMKRPASAIAVEHSTVVRISRSLFQRVLESDPAAAIRLRDEFAGRTSRITDDIQTARTKLDS